MQSESQLVKQAQQKQLSRKGLGLLLCHPHRSVHSEDFQTSIQTTPRGYIPRDLSKQHNQLVSISTSNSNTNTRKLISADKQTIIITEEHDVSCARCRDQLNDTKQLQDLYDQLRQRCHSLDILISVISGKEFISNVKNQTSIQKIQDLLTIISSTLQQSARNEIDLASKVREVERKNSMTSLYLVQFSTLQMKEIKLSDKNSSLQNVIDLHQSKKNSLIQENQRLQKLLNFEKKQNLINSKKVLALEKRIEFLLEYDVNQGLNPNDKLRLSLNELLKENEQIKRELDNKKQELDRVNGKLNQYMQLASRLQKTLGNTKRKQQELLVDNPNSVLRKDDIDLLINFTIPKTLDYRVISQKMNAQHLIIDLDEQGTYQTCQQTFNLTLEQQKEQFQILAEQFTEYKGFAEKLHQLNFHLDKFNYCTNFQDIISQTNRILPYLFNCENARLWLIESLNGTIFTYQQPHQQVKALQHKGQIAEIFKLKIAQNIARASSKPLLYRITDQEEPDFAKNALLLPIFSVCKDRFIRGVLEITNTDKDLFSFDEEYLGIILSHSLAQIIQRIIDNQAWGITKKYRGIMMGAFNELMTCKSKEQFSQQVSLGFNQIFSCSQVVFYFVEDERLVRYTSSSVQSYELTYGLAGMVASSKQKYIINDVKTSIHFNQAVDIYSLLPIFAQPLVDNHGNVLAVVETVLKSKLKYHMEKEQLLTPADGMLGMEEPLTEQMNQFCELISSALQNNTKL